MSAESKIQNRVIQYARSKGWMVKRNYMGPGAARHWPDVEFFGPGGIVVLIEFKAPGKEATKAQKHNHAKLQDLGHRVYVCDSIESGMMSIDAWSEL